MKQMDCLEWLLLALLAVSVVGLAGAVVAFWRFVVLA